MVPEAFPPRSCPPSPSAESLVAFKYVDVRLRHSLQRKYAGN